MRSPRAFALMALVLTVACASVRASSPTVTASPVQVTDSAPVPTPTRAPIPTYTSAPAPTITPTPAPALRQLTTGGCCVQPFWAPDGSQVWFIDKPDEDGPSGVWGVDVSGGDPRFIADRVGVYSPEGNLIAYPEGGRTYIERVGGERWVAPSDGRAISFSPDEQLILWQAASSSANFDQRVVEVWVARADGSDPRRAAQLMGGGVSGWFPDNQRVLVSVREPERSDSSLAALNLADGSLTIIGRGARLRGGLLSPEGGWVAYQITFSGDPAQDGLWLARTDGTEARRLDVFGAYRWRSEGRLLVIPLEASSGSHRLLEIDAVTGQVRALTDPLVTPFRVAVGDWVPSPDGNHVVFVSADDHNLWVMDLP